MTKKTSGKKDYYIIETRGVLSDELLLLEGKKFKTVRSRERTIPFSTTGKIRSLMLVLDDERVIDLRNVSSITLVSKTKKARKISIVVSAGRPVKQ